MPEHQVSIGQDLFDLLLGVPQETPLGQRGLLTHRVSFRSQGEPRWSAGINIDAPELELEVAGGDPS
jgi:hypothetical protein